MRLFDAARTVNHAALAAAMTGFFFLSMPVVGMLARAPQHETLDYRQYGSGGDDADDVQFVWVAPVEAPVVERLDAPAGEEGTAGPAEDVPLAPEATPSVHDHSNEASDGTAVKDDLAIPRAGTPAVLVGRERVASRGQDRRVDVRSAPKKRSKGKCAEHVPHIEKLGERHFEVDRAFIESYAFNMKKLETLGAVGHHEGDDGKRDGFIVGRIRCGTPLHQGGLRNGDVVHSVNGKKVNNVLQAIGAYRKVKKADEVEIELTRRNGKRLTFTYELY